MFAVESSESLPLGGMNSWSDPNNPSDRPQTSQSTYTPIVWSADPDGPTILTTPAPITIRPSFFTPLPQNQSGGQPDPSTSAAMPDAARNAIIPMPGMMGPPPPTRVKVEEVPTELSMPGAGPFPTSQPPQQWHPASLIPQPQFHPGFHMGSNPPNSAPLFQQPAMIPAQDAYLSKMPMHEISAAGGVQLNSFKVEATPLQGQDQAQQPRGWHPAQQGLFQMSEPARGQLSSNMNASTSTLAQGSSSISPSVDIRPSTSENGQSHSIDSAGVFTNSSTLNEPIWPNTKIGNDFDNLLDGSSPFAHDPERRQAGLDSYPMHPSQGPMPQDILTRLRTSPQDSAGPAAFGSGADPSYGQDDKMRRPYTALPQGGSKAPDFHFGKEDNLAQHSEKERKQSSRFVQKLHAMVHDPEYQHLICWNSAGTSVVIINFDDFARDVLGKHFKHSNFSSFIRQLNMYGFYKVNKIPRGSRQSGNNEKAQTESQIWEFAHPKFLKNRPDLLEEIKRRAIETEGGRSDARDHPMSAHAQANAYLSNQVNELNVRVGELNIGLDKAGMRNAHLRACNMKLSQALRSTLDLLRNQTGGALPDFLVQHERLLSEIPLADDMNQTQAGMMAAPPTWQHGAPLMTPSAQFVVAPGWSMRARADTNVPPLGPATCAPHQASPISAPASISMFPTRESQATITPQASNSGMTITNGNGGGSSSSPVIVTQNSTRPPSSATSSSNTPSRPALRLDARDQGASSGRLATPEGLTSASSVTLLSTVSAPNQQHPISFAFDQPVSSASTDNIPATSSAGPSDLQSMNYITGNTSVDSLQQLQPNKQQRIMTPNAPSSVLGLPPRSSSLMAAFESTSSGHGQDGSSTSGSIHTVSAQPGMPAQPNGINMADFANPQSGTPSQATSQGLVSPSTSSLASLIPGQASGLSAFTAADTCSTRTSLISFGTNPNAAITQHQQEQQAAAMAAFGKMQTSDGNAPSPTLMGPPSGQPQQHRIFAFEGPPFTAGSLQHPQQIQIQLNPLPVLHTGSTATKRKMPS